MAHRRRRVRGRVALRPLEHQVPFDRFWARGSDVATAWPQQRSHSRKAVALQLLLGLSSVPVLLFNQSRELVPVRSLPLLRDRQSYLTQSAMEQLFVNQLLLLGPYQCAIEVIARSNASQLGLILGFDSWEYPVWRMLHDRKLDHPVRIEHVNVSGNPPWPLGPFFPDVVFWSVEEGEPPPTLVVDGWEFVRIGPPGMAVVYAGTEVIEANLALRSASVNSELGFRCLDDILQ